MQKHLLQAGYGGGFQAQKEEEEDGVKRQRQRRREEGYVSTIRLQPPLFFSLSLFWCPPTPEDGPNKLRQSLHFFSGYIYIYISPSPFSGPFFFFEFSANVSKVDKGWLMERDSTDRGKQLESEEEQKRTKVK